MIGAIAEEEVLLIGKQYQREGRALLLKRYEPYRRIGGARRGKEFKAIPLHRSGPDFEIFLPDGRSGMIEVKAGERACLEGTQAQMLKQLSEWGHIAAVLYQTPLREWYLIPYVTFAPAKSRSKKFLMERGVHLGQTPDFLDKLCLM